jgi:hypothetical protein
MQWFLELIEELGIDCQVGHPAKIARPDSGSKSTKIRATAISIERSGMDASHV